MYRIFRSAGLLTAMAIASTQAIGADVPATGVTSFGDLEEIIVTAQRRSESLEKTPVSIAVITAAELSQKAIFSESDLQSAVSGLTIRETQNSNQLNYAIRGQSVDAFSSSRPAVLPYFNEVQASPAGSSAFYDLQSIQVLKGPQGTLFGRNATGGAVLFTTVKPTNDYDGYIDVQAGNYDYTMAQGAINLPIVSDILLSRIAAFYEYREGFQRDSFSGQTIGVVDRSAVRGSLTFVPSEQFRNELVVDFEHAGGSNTVPVTYSVYPPGFNNAPIPANFLFTPAVNSLLGPGAWAAYLAANPRAYAGGVVAFGALQNARGPYIVSVTPFPSHKSDNTVASNISTFDMSGDTQIRNIFGYERATSTDFIDIPGAPYLIEASGPTGARLDNWLVSDELQVVGKALGGHLSHVEGIYYSDEQDDTFSDIEFVGLEPFIPATRQHNDGRVVSKSIAGYAQGTYDLSDATGIAGLGVTAGGRYTSERDLGSQLPSSVYYNFGLIHPGAQNVISSTTGKASWQFGLQEQVSSDWLIYATTRRSFRSGGINIDSPPFPGTAANGGAQFDPEVATDIEVGTKFQGAWAGIPLRLNVAFYNQWVTDIQRSIYVGLPALNGGLAGLTVNIPKALIRGIEIDGQVSPTSWLNIGGNLAYTDARFTRDSATVFGNTVTYGPFADAPRNSGLVYTELLAPLPDHFATLTFRSDVYAQSRFYFGSLNNTIVPGTDVAGYALVNFRLGLDDIEHSGFSVAAYVKNAFNRVYYVGGVPVGSVMTVNSAIPGNPRTFFAEMRYKW